jgi:hypothetical protein
MALFRISSIGRRWCQAPERTYRSSLVPGTGEDLIGRRWCQAPERTYRSSLVPGTGEDL